MKKPKKKMSPFWQKSEFRIFYKNVNPFFRQIFAIFDKNLNPFLAINIPFFGCYSKNISQNEECHTSLAF